jgi:hypothetical protein
MPVRSKQRLGLTASSVFTTLLLLAALPACAQETKKKQPRQPMHTGSSKNSDSTLVWSFTCKYPVVIMPGCGEEEDRVEVFSERIPLPVAAAREPLLKVHGNVLYNYTYRSYIDTPFAEHDISQHFVQTNLNFLYRNKYPFQVVITNRSSNSQWFQNATDVSVQFNRSQLLENIKGNLKENAAGMVKTIALNEFDNLYRQKLQQLEADRAWLNSPARIQEMVAAKEAQLTAAYRQPATELISSITDVPANLTSRAGIPSLGRENKFALQALKNAGEAALAEKLKNQQVVDTGAISKYEEKKKQVAKLEKEVKELYGKATATKKAAQDSVNKIKAEINSLKTGPGLYSFMKKHGLSKDSLKRGQKLLLSVTKIGIGRSWVDYSELTVKNISLTGFNIEMNPLPWYFAFAAGRVNYRFRDFLVKNSRKLPAQSLYLIRAGIGEKEKNNLVFTYYNGKKNVLSSTPSVAPAAMQPVLGFSAETRFTLNENNYVVAEVAKSSYQNAGAPLSISQLLTKATDWKTRSNEAYSIKLFSAYPQTNTKFTAWYRRLGEHFQSFNLYALNTNQEAFSVRLNQQLWKKRIVLDAAIRKNDFTSPIAAPSFSNTAIFKSLQLTIRVPRYPFLTVGYYPSSQLSLSNGNVLVENQYNTLNAVMSHNYTAKKINMNTNAVFTKFYNSSTDTGFIYYNATSYSINHSFFLGPLLLQTGFSLIDQQNLKMKTLEQLAGYQFKSKLTVSASIKWNRLHTPGIMENLFGGTATAGIYLKKLGTIQLNYDRAYLPGFNQVLMPVDIGRVSFYREF